MRAILAAFVAILVGIAGCSPIGAGESKPRKNSSATARNRPKSAAAGESRPASIQDADAATDTKTETAVFAGGCFWCTEFAFEQVAGVIDVQSGYCGGSESTANYELVHLGSTGHAEAIRVTYDPDKVTYDDLLTVFFDAHDPTQKNRQGADIGTQYRSAIFYADEDQKKAAEEKMADLKAKRVYKRSIKTKLEPLEEFYPAELFHQNFARRNPRSPYIQGHAVPKAYRVRVKNPELIRKEE